MVNHYRPKCKHCICLAWWWVLHIRTLALGMEVWKFSPVSCAVICHVRQDRVRCSCSTQRSSDTGEAVRGATGISPLTRPPLCSSLKHLLVSGNEKGKRYLDGTMSSVFQWEGVRGCRTVILFCMSAHLHGPERIELPVPTVWKTAAPPLAMQKFFFFLVTVLNNERRTESCDCVPCFRSLPSRSEWANYSPSQMTINHVSLLVLLGNR